MEKIVSQVDPYEHRRALIESELLRLGQVFYLDVVAYAVMSNHYHVVLFIDTQAQKAADAKKNKYGCLRNISSMY